MRAAPDRSTMVLGSVLALVVLWAALASRAWRPTALACAVALGIAAAPRRPLSAVALAFAGLFLAAGSVAADDPFLALLVAACFMAGRYCRPSRQPWAAAAVLLLLSSNLLQPGRRPDAAAVFPVLLTAGPWLLGFVVQIAVDREQQAVRRAALLETQQAMHIRQATAEERLHIAREFHDIVAHEISAVSLQAQLARRVAEAGGTVSAATLSEIERTAQHAMNDVRRLLGVLRASDPVALDPAPGLGELDALIEAERSLGSAVVFDERGARRALPPALSHAGYRIVQECLCNARRHGDGEARLLVEWESHSLRLTVSNPTTAAGPRCAAGSGHGLAGIGERAALFGGSVRTTRSDDAWTVQVVLPAAVLT